MSGVCNSLSSCVNFLLRTIFNPLLAVLIAISVVIFFWGVVRYIASAGASEAKINGREMILWGIVALVVLMSIWGIVALVSSTFFGNSAYGSYTSSSVSTGSNSMPTERNGGCTAISGNC
ncbi:MAG: hypothetical protein KGJ34_02495 [Patescibacteria group bacterium]|nr:hypothetical protein [Patescibacteria group bacterium]